MSKSQIQIELTIGAATPSVKPKPQTIALFQKDMDADRSSFFHLPIKTDWEKELSEHKDLLAKRIQQFQIKTFLHLGIGGSGLGAETLIKALYNNEKGLKFHFLDNIDPDAISDVLAACMPSNTMVYVVSKSGTTMETLAQFIYIYEWMSKALGEEQAKERLVFCTDPEKGDLRKLAQQWKVPCFSIPPNLGGRFSVLGAVGLFPAWVAGIDTLAIIKGSADYREHILAELSAGKTPSCYELAQTLVDQNISQHRNITVLMPYSQKLKTMSAWFTQLWAESLGKQGKGMTPVAAVGATDQHSILQLLRDGPQDKVVGFIELEKFNSKMPIKMSPSMKALPSLQLVSGIDISKLLFEELKATRQVMINNNRPCFTIKIPSLTDYTLGQLFYFFEVLTAFAGYILEIDPFDQPGVEEGKILTKKALG